MSPNRPTSSPDRLRVLELFCGIGGMAATLGSVARVVAAVDLDRVGTGVYRANFDHPVHVRNLETASVAELADFGAQLWTMSPPCQPYTHRGKQRDLDDPRAASLANLLRLLPQARPAYLLLENVPGFQGSRAHQRLREALDGEGYGVLETVLCPSEIGWPNRRRRFYLVAARRDVEPLRPLPEPPTGRVALAELLDDAHDGDLELAVEPDLPLRYEGALHLVRRDDPEAVTACFTSAYGRSPVRSGSYLVLDDHHPTRDGGLPRLRRFHPREILTLLGFPSAYRLPPDLPVANGWRLAGNSLSLPAVRHVLSTIPGLGGWM